MSKVLTEAPLTTRNARAKLAAGSHWRAIDPDTHLGYRKGVRGGRWLVRWYQGEGGYQQRTLATADDAFDADGASILDFNQAAAKARAHVAECRVAALAKAHGPIITVRHAIEAYLLIREAKEKTQRGEMGLKRDARSRLTRHVLSTSLAKKPLHELDDDALADWRDTLPANLAGGTVRRLINDLKAALNATTRANRKRLPSELSNTIRGGLKVDDNHADDARRQVLPDSDVRRLIVSAWAVDGAGEWEGDLARLVVVLAATGARFSQIARMKVADVQPSEGRLMVPTSRKGRGVKKADRTAVRVGEDVIETLRPALAGRKGSAPLLERWRHVQERATVWKRGARGAWLNASELTRPWSEITINAGMPVDTVPYSLRHSSIVRGLRAGLPVRLVAALHDTSTAMIERHYSAFVVDAMDELSARAVVPLTTAPVQIISLERKAKG